MELGEYINWDKGQVGYSIDFLEREREKERMRGWRENLFGGVGTLPYDIPILLSTTRFGIVAPM